MRARVRASKCLLVYLRRAEGAPRRSRSRCLRPRHGPSPSPVGFECGCVGVETCAAPGGALPPNILRAAGRGACERAQRSASDGTPVTAQGAPRHSAQRDSRVARAHSPHRSVNKRQMGAEAGRTKSGRRTKGSVLCVVRIGRLAGARGQELAASAAAIARATTQKLERTDKGSSQRDAGPTGCGHLACPARVCRLWLVVAQRGRRRGAVWRAWSQQPKY